MTDKDLIEYTQRWIYLHKNNAYQREAAKYMQTLVNALEAHVAPVDDWEYGSAVASDPTDASAEGTRESAEKNIIAWNEATARMDRKGDPNSGPAILMYRRKAGEWEEVK